MKIAKLQIKSFRGIPGDCELSFLDKNGNATSSIIYGGNGSGKSSIVDAIEYCLQGRIERSGQLKNAARPSTVNFSTPNILNPEISITFDDGTNQRRQILISHDDESGEYILKRSESEAHKSFSSSPVVLRRNDIISYNMTKEAERQVLMLQFLYNEDIEYKLSKDPEVIDIDEKLIRQRHRREAVLQQIPNVINVSIEELSANSSNVEQYIRERFSPIGQKFGFTSSGKPKTHIRPEIFDKAISLAEEYYKLSQKYKKLKDKRKKLVSNKTPEKFAQLEEVFKQASKYLTTSFKEISNVNYIDDIRLSIANVSITSLTIKIKLINGREVTPNQIFSEANYDLMVLLLYLSLIRVSVDNGQEKLLVLDDVLQSVDASIRASFVVYILKELKDWQLFITCHDRLWLNQLKYLFNNSTHKFKEYNITNWSFTNGPVIQEKNLSSKDDTLKKAIETGNIRIMASISGLFLEKICQELSMSMKCRIERKEGDRYTIGDLWPSLRKALKKTPLEKIIAEIDKSLCIRNLLGSHYNKWAESFSDEEVIGFATAVQELYEKTFCGKCCNWIAISRSKSVDYECPCRHLQY